MTKGKRILVAEKDDAIRELVVMRLGARHHKVFEATQSKQVLRILEREVVDLILLSSEMEPVNGKLLIQVLRSRSHLMAVPVIMLTSEDDLTDLMLGHEKGFDDFLVKPFSPLVLQLRVNLNIAKTMERVEANALTHLPGNHAIEKIITKKVKAGEKFSVLYIDINHFKAFNDHYGFQKGDDVIIQTARLLVATAYAVAPEGSCFVGHIGGDDFVVVLAPELEEVFARQFIDDFDSIMPTYYSKPDRETGFIRVENRRGQMENFPLMSCSVAGCTNVYRNYANLREIAQDAAEVKTFLKSQPGSHYLQDRRSSPIKKLDDAVHILEPEIKSAKIKKRTEPLGQILVNAGLITEEQLTEALKKHFETGWRLGQTLIHMNLVSSEDVGRMLEKKLKIPYVNLKSWRPDPALLHIFNTEFIHHHRVVPVELAEGQIRLAMCDPFDLKTIDAVERITGLKPVPCLALEDEFEHFFETLTPPEEQAIDKML
ncbi:MAG TPA: response regulator [Candidatus Omnitrophota bacterium]|nr:response regulator [Candidatus Omnitrophota bacterium]HPS36939.1 response regulator [Candidatus Omnitrophota bacterium]